MDRIIDMSVSAGGVLVLLLVGWLAAKWVRRIVRKVVTKLTSKHKARIKKIGITFDVASVAASLAYYVIMYVVVTSALEKLGVDVGIIENLVNTTISLIPIALVADWVLNGLSRTKKLLKGKV